MNLTNLTKSVLVASALTFSSFGANASAMSDVSIDVTNLTLDFFAPDGVTPLTIHTDPLVPLAPNEVVLSGVSIDLTGTNADATLDGTTVGQSYTDPTDPFSPLAINLNANLTSGTSSANANSTVNGNFLLGGADGSTSADINVEGNSTGEANSQIVNILESAFIFTSSVDAKVQISFDWIWDLYLAITDEGGTANAQWGLTVDLTQGTGFGSQLFSFDIKPETFNASTIDANSIGQVIDEDDSGSVLSNMITISENTSYVLRIAQHSNVAATSTATVPEPASIAILSLGLLGFAGAARRRNS